MCGEGRGGGCGSKSDDVVEKESISMREILFREGKKAKGGRDRKEY